MSAYHILDRQPRGTNSTNPRHSAVHTTGRGGAGNLVSFQNTKTTPSSHTYSNSSNQYHHDYNLRRNPSARPITSRQRRNLSTGRGGAGNFQSSSEYAIFSFDEELEQQLKLEKDVAPVFHVGRGGAGNVVFSDSYNLPRKRSSTGGCSSSSSSSNGSSNDDGKVKEWPRRNLDTWKGALRKRMPSS